ncbi:MAG: PSD1 and planctomycete cytochrome C domain-containing protein [Acidobacteriota bacterium]|nr:PSD1 and planctomycete cytochrome C domain-containing protein [Acidobacteriota bacterium]MDE3266280.1 PSD1 and planctomycete cytochrome C domain-containing protein [Acidobacteriota bacterium]
MRISLRSGAVILAAVLLGGPAAAAEFAPEDLEFFEQKIRPILVEHCYTCHNSTEIAESGLRLDYRDGLLEGGMRGPAVEPGKPRSSLLLRAMRHPSLDFRMPLGGAKLPDDVIADFERWIEIGAPDPRNEPPSADALKEATAWRTILEQRKGWWSLQPIADPEPPEVADADWSRSAIDRFLARGIADAGLEPAPLAEPRTVMRRLSYVLTGLPPTPAQVDDFVRRAAIDRDAAVADEVDRLLADPAFGERWARHWMDWVRYAETHGSEGDPPVPYAWRYRDYLIRALNADIPIDRLIREHLAGDLLDEPRMNPELGINESAIGIAQYRFVLHGFGPTDALDEQVRFTENQIDVVSKAFLGMTVACARCHDHKFDAISQTDFYALYGTLVNGRPGVQTIDDEARRNAHRDDLTRLKADLKQVLAEAWIDAAASVPARLRQPDGPWAAALTGGQSPYDPLYPYVRTRGIRGRGAFAKQWQELAAAYERSRQQLEARQQAPAVRRWDLSRTEDVEKWYRHGNGLPDAKPQGAGSYEVAQGGGTIVADILPGGVYTHSLTNRHNGTFSSPRFLIEARQKLAVRIAGRGGAVARYVVQNYPQRGEVYPIETLSDGEWRWQHWDLDYWDGDHAYIELVTAADHPMTGESSGGRSDRSWFGITEAVVLDETGELPHDQPAEFTAPLFEIEGAPGDRDELAARYGEAVQGAVAAWRDGSMTDAEARFLASFVRRGLLPNDVGDVPEAEPIVASIRKLEEAVPVPTRSPAVLAGPRFDQPLMERGNHRQLGEPVAQRFLEAIDPEPYADSVHPRLALAESIMDPGNPLTARVIANRLWVHTFGRGIVATPDNFGQMGELPSNAALLDHLATTLREDGWSLKTFVRRLASSRAFQLESTPPAAARERDPRNDLLSHAHLRRLEAEAVRDSMLIAAGQLEPVATSETLPEPGWSNRRSVYVQVIRNQPDPLLHTLDLPTPVTTKGQRDQTNVPAQSLLMMNNTQVMHLAARFADRIARDPGLHSDRERIAAMFRLALGRLPTEPELGAAERFLDQAQDRKPAREDVEAWNAAALDRREESAGIREFTADKTRGVLRFYHRASAPKAMAAWEFEDQPKNGRVYDAIGFLPLRLGRHVRQDDGALWLGTSDVVTSKPIQRSLDEYTLEAWVAGGAEPGPVHLVLALDGRGAWTAYRNGAETDPESVRQELPMSLEKGRVQFTGAGDAPLGVLQARLYDRVLAPADIAASALGNIEAPSEAEQARIYRSSWSRIARLEAEADQLEQSAGGGDAWRRLAHAMFNLKEFMYLR